MRSFLRERPGEKAKLPAYVGLPQEGSRWRDAVDKPEYVTVELTGASKASLPEYVEPVLELLEKAHAQLASVPDYTQGRRRGRPRTRGN